MIVFKKVVGFVLALTVIDKYTQVVLEMLGEVLEDNVNDRESVSDGEDETVIERLAVGVLTSVVG